MFRLFRYLFTSLLVLLGVGLGLRFALGEKFVPWTRAAQRTMVEKIEQLVDRYEMELEKARHVYEQAKERSIALRGQKVQAVAGVKTIQREIQLAQKVIDESKRQLAVLEERLRMKDELRLVSGRVATPTEIQASVQDYANRIQVAEEKVSYLQQILARRQTRQQKLVELEEQSPSALQRLGNSLDFLARKLDLYRELQQWAQEETAADSQLVGLYENAQRTLEDAHAKLDQKLAELDALLEPALKIEPATANETTTPEKLAADIRQILQGWNAGFQK
jgi:chromosome segregation ATPase